MTAAVVDVERGVWSTRVDSLLDVLCDLRHLHRPVEVSGTHYCDHCTVPYPCPCHTALTMGAPITHHHPSGAHTK